jgi:dihydrofolate reductase
VTAAGRPSAAGEGGAALRSGSPRVSLIAAMGEDRTIGKDGDLPWRLPDEFAHFKRTTRGHVVITGRRNYESMDGPLPQRHNLVLTRQEDYEAEGAEVVGGLDEALRRARQIETEEIFIIGGGEIYRQALERDLADRLYLTTVHGRFGGDTLFPAIDPAKWALIAESHHGVDERHAYAFTIQVYERQRGG